MMKMFKKKYKFLSDNTKVYSYKIDAEHQSVKEIMHDLKKINKMDFKEHYMTGDLAYWRVSNKLVGSNFREKIVEQNDAHDAVFYYS